jgi:hypothetical protein
MRWDGQKPVQKKHCGSESTVLQGGSLLLTTSLTNTVALIHSPNLLLSLHYVACSGICLSLKRPKRVCKKLWRWHWRFCLSVCWLILTWTPNSFTCAPLSILPQEYFARVYDNSTITKTTWEGIFTRPKTSSYSLPLNIWILFSVAPPASSLLNFILNIIFMKSLVTTKT